MCYSHLEKPEEGMKYIDEAIRINPFYRGGILQKGMLHLQLKEKKNAKKLFQKALSLSPDDEQIEVLYSIANCYFFLKEYEDTINCCENIIYNYPNEKLEALLINASCYYELNHPDKCLNYIAQALKINEHHFDESILKDKRFSAMFTDLTKLTEILNNQK